MGDMAVLIYKKFLLWHLNPVIVAGVKEHIADLSLQQSGV